MPLNLTGTQDSSICLRGLRLLQNDEEVQGTEPGSADLDSQADAWDVSGGPLILAMQPSGCAGISASGADGRPPREQRPLYVAQSGLGGPGDCAGQSKLVRTASASGSGGLPALAKADLEGGSSGLRRVWSTCRGRWHARFDGPLIAAVTPARARSRGAMSNVSRADESVGYRRLSSSHVSYGRGGPSENSTVVMAAGCGHSAGRSISSISTRCSGTKRASVLIDRPG